MGQRELTRPGIIRFASNFPTQNSLIKSRAALRHMIVGEEWTSSTFAMTTTRIDVVNCILKNQVFGPLVEKSCR